MSMRSDVIPGNQPGMDDDEMDAAYTEAERARLIESLRIHVPTQDLEEFDSKLTDLIAALRSESTGTRRYEWRPDYGPDGLPETALPERVVVGANGAYWRDYGEHYSMCPVSDDNDPVEVRAIYVRSESTGTLDVERLAEAIHQTHKYDDPFDRLFCPACLDDAVRWAAEYARLTKAER